MAKIQRAGAFVIAFLFLATTVGFTLLVLIQSRGNDDFVNQAQDIQSSINNQSNQETQMDQLQGTKLANFEPINTVGELKVIDLEEGSGEVVKEGATVTAHYTGALAKDGTIFQSSKDFGQPIPFSLTQVIQGWTNGVPGMKVGGKRRLIIPADQAYGPQQREGIPANSDLVFDIEVVSVEQ